jgi:hypothetical protein
VNEIELLQSFREDVPDPDGATVRAARAVLMERIEGYRGRGRRSGRSSRRRIALGLAAAAAAIVAVALVLTILVPRGGSSAAAADLRRFAVVAERQPAPQPLGQGEYYYLTEEGRDRIIVVSEDHGAYAAGFSLVREYWIGPDGSGRLLDTPGELVWPSARDKTRGEADGGAAKLVGSSDQTYAPGQLVGSEYPGGAFATLPEGYDFQTLPRDTEALYEVIQAAAAARESTDAGEAVQPTPSGTFGLFIQLLRNPLTPPDVRSALYKALAYIPGITVVPERTIPDIGTGAAVFHESQWGKARVRMEFLVDPATSEVLGYQETQLDRAYWTDADPPFVTTSIAYATPRVVDSITERP